MVKMTPKMQVWIFTNSFYFYFLHPIWPLRGIQRALSSADLKTAQRVSTGASDEVLQRSQASATGAKGDHIGRNRPLRGYRKNLKIYKNSEVQTPEA